MKILIIEDDPFFQKFYSQKLTEHGHSVIVADNGRKGIENAMAEKPNLIILDLVMPVMDGFEVLERINKVTYLKKIPILVFSTLGQEEDVKKAKDLGAKDVINKSFFDLNLLLSKIEEVQNNSTPLA